VHLVQQVLKVVRGKEDLQVQLVNGEVMAFLDVQENVDSLVSKAAQVLQVDLELLGERVLLVDLA